jgi:hypothetical protein
MITSKHLISLEDAKKLTQDYREKKKKILRDEYGSKNTLPLSETFDRDAFDYILGQKGCERLRIYFGMNEAEEVNLVIVGVNANNEDILTPQASTDIMMKTTDNDPDPDPIAEGGDRCPPTCPPPSGL